MTSVITRTPLASVVISISRTALGEAVMGKTEVLNQLYHFS